MKFSFSALIFMMVFLYIGGILAGFLVSVMPFSVIGWSEGFLTALIQVLILTLLGVIIKLDLWTILIGSGLIVIGGVIGGLVAEYFGAWGLWGTIIILAVQSMLLMATGLAKQSGKTKVG